MIVVKKKSLIIISVLIATVFTLFLCLGAIGLSSVDSSNKNKIKIVLDAGHGGIDGGVQGVSTKVKESEINLKVVKKLEKIFISAGFNVILTRNSDAGLYGVATKNLKRRDMEKRCQIIKKAMPEVVISIHMNKYSLSTRRGAQVFYKKDDEKAFKLAKAVQDSFNNMEEASRECHTLTGDYYILNCSPYTSIIAECGFLSNPQDEALLITDKYQEEIAYAIFKGVITYLVDATFNC